MKITKCYFLGFILFWVAVTVANAQNPRIKCYFNHPVNTGISTGTNAVYLNGSFADTVSAYIDRAKYTVDIAQYNYTSGSTSQVAKIATAANNAALRGVTIRWISNGSSGNSGLSLLNPIIKTLASPTTSGYGIMHDKFMVIDVNSVNDSDAITMTASYDWSTTQTNNDFNNIVVIQDKNLSLAYYNEFNKMWGGTGSSPNTATSTFGTYKTPSTVTSFNVNGTPVEIYFSPKDNADTHLKTAINTANNEIFFGIYTFTDNTVATAIKNKINGGVAAKGIIDQFSQTYSPYSTLTPVMGTNLILYNGNYIYHNKMIVIDADHPSSDPQVVTGSYNWSYSGAHTNDENTIIIHDSVIANQYLQSLCQNFADLGGAPCVSVLPLQLLYFKANLQRNGKPVLEWAIANQESISFYEVEKSNDGLHFNDLAKINAESLSGGDKHYSYMDTHFNDETSLYRLRATNSDGKIIYSNIVTINRKPIQEISLYPNPVKNMLFAQQNLVKRTVQTIKISDLAGKVLQSQTITSDPGISTAVINTSGLSSGTYFLVIQGDKTSVSKFIKN